MGLLGLVFQLTWFVAGVLCGVLLTALLMLHLMTEKSESKTAVAAAAAATEAELQRRFSKPLNDEGEDGSYCNTAVVDIAGLRRMVALLNEVNDPTHQIDAHIRQIHHAAAAGTSPAAATPAATANTASSAPASSLAAAASAGEGIRDEDPRMATILDGGGISIIERELQESLSGLRDQSKQHKGVVSFLADMGKARASFSRDLAKLASSAKSSISKHQQQLERKEDLLLHSWWQALHMSVEYASFDEEQTAQLLQEDIGSYGAQILEGAAAAEKRLAAEAAKRFQNMREHVALFESKRRDRDKYKEKVAKHAVATTTAAAAMTAATVAAATDDAVVGGGGIDSELQRRVAKMQTYEDLLASQSKILFTAQKEFYGHVARMASDIQLTELKAAKEMHSMLGKLATGLEQNQSSQRSICDRMKLQLTNAANSLVQMLREEAQQYRNNSSNNSSNGSRSWSGLAGDEGTLFDAQAQRLRQRMNETGVQGFELDLQKVLLQLIQMSQPPQQQRNDDIGWRSSNPTTTATTTTTTTASTTTPIASTTPITATAAASSAVPQLQPLQATAAGRFDMHAEATACLAASDPALLPLLPQSFSDRCIGVETCVWFNAFSGRVYRDIAHSKYFYHWFCAKLSQMLNRGPRPGYVDAFRVSDVRFGKLPPLLMNVKWSPRINSNSNNSSNKSSSNSSSNNNSSNKSSNSSSNSSANSAGPTIAAAAAAAAGCGGSEKDEAGAAFDAAAFVFESEDESDISHYAACTADMAFRSGITITINTKLWLNWPRDRYAAVPVTLTVNLAEISGKILFGCTRSYSFMSFLGDPLMRISVNNEVGKGMMKFKDMPQLSDFITRKLREFVHNKIVHPSSHKFRLVWPRNWWPPGTEHMFDTSPVEVNLSNAGSSSGASNSAATSANAGASTSTTAATGAANEDADGVDVDNSSAAGTGAGSDEGGSETDTTASTTAAATTAAGGKKKRHKGSSRWSTVRNQKKADSQQEQTKEGRRFDDFSAASTATTATAAESNNSSSSGSNLKARVSNWIQKYASSEPNLKSAATATATEGTSKQQQRQQQQQQQLHPALLSMRAELEADSELWELTCHSIVTKHREEMRQAASHKLLAAAGCFDRSAAATTGAITNANAIAITTTSAAAVKSDGGSGSEDSPQQQLQLPRPPLFPDENTKESDSMTMLLSSGTSIIVEEDYIDQHGSVEGAAFRILNASPQRSQKATARGSNSSGINNNNSSNSKCSSSVLFSGDAAGPIVRSAQRNLNRGSTSSLLTQQCLLQQSVSTLTTLLQAAGSPINPLQQQQQRRAVSSSSSGHLREIAESAMSRSLNSESLAGSTRGGRFTRRHSDTAVVLMCRSFNSNSSNISSSSSCSSDGDSLLLSRAASVSDFRAAVLETSFQQRVVDQPQQQTAVAENSAAATAATATPQQERASIARRISGNNSSSSSAVTAATATSASATKWFSESTATKIAKAKSKFKEFKAKHFAKDGSNNRSNSSSNSSSSSISVLRNSATALKEGGFTLQQQQQQSLLLASDCDEQCPSECSSSNFTDSVAATVDHTVDSTPGSSRPSSLKRGELPPSLLSLSSAATPEQTHEKAPTATAATATDDGTAAATTARAPVAAATTGAVEGKVGKVGSLMRRLSSKHTAAAGTESDAGASSSSMSTPGGNSNNSSTTLAAPMTPAATAADATPSSVSGSAVKYMSSMFRSKQSHQHQQSTSCTSSSSSSANKK